MASTARLDELKKKFDENPRRYFAPLANEHRKSGDLDQAIALCRTHLPQQPGHISGHIVLAQALYEAGSLDESREIFQTALGLDPENLIALRYLGDIARDTADVATARSWYQRVLEVDPRNDEIVQMVRELDAPGAAQASAEQPAAAESSFAPPTSAAAPPIESPVPTPEPAATNDARFAPLSLEEIDLDVGTPEPAAASAQQVVEPQPAPSTEAFDVHASWEQAVPAADTSDTPGVDPFDLGTHGGAEALFAASTEASEDDFFLTELAGADAPHDGGETPDYGAQDPWTPAETSEPAVADVQQASEVASQADAEPIDAFEEGAFYLEPAPAAPDEVPPGPHAPVVSAETALPEVEAGGLAPAAPNEAEEDAAAQGLDAFAAEYYAPASPVAPSRPTPASVERLEPVAEAAPNEEVVASAPEQPVVEHEAPAVEASPAYSSHDDLGLEVMEFVPPSSEPPAPSAPRADVQDVDPAIGRTPQMIRSESSVAPAAFVTETMAELYLQQGFRNEALEVYRELLARNPSDSSLRERIEQIESGSISSLGMAMVSENVVESAIRRQSARPARSVRSFFASLASRRAPTPPAPEEQHDTTESADPEQIAPLMSAAETLASFDPFADAAEQVSAESWPDVVPNEAPAEPDLMAALPPEQPSVARARTPVATPVASQDSAPARRSLEDLFPDTPITPRAEAAAETLATAFGRSEPQGRPTRAASSELSLDHVFRGAPEGAPPADGGFSFDQFFSDSRAGSEASATAATGSEFGSNGSGDANDIEQFTAWLEGLKKK